MEPVDASSAEVLVVSGIRASARRILIRTIAGSVARLAFAHGVLGQAKSKGFRTISNARTHELRIVDDPQGTRIRR